VNKIFRRFIANYYSIVLSNREACNRYFLVYQTIFSVVGVICNSNRCQFFLLFLHFFFYWGLFSIISQGLQKFGDAPLETNKNSQLIKFS
jgi:hypothetical protein